MHWPERGLAGDKLPARPRTRKSNAGPMKKGIIGTMDGGEGTIAVRLPNELLENLFRNLNGRSMTSRTSKSFRQILGWLLLRKCGLPSHARLAVLSATNNVLELDIVEKALRDQEEELMASERHRDHRDSRSRRS